MGNSSIHDALNQEFSQKLIPNTVIHTLLLLVGMIGNILVLIIYSLKMKHNMEARYFIPILAVYDTLTSLVSCVYFIVDNTYFVHFSSDVVCRIFVFLTGLTMMTSVAFLLAIAVQRYLKICRPLGKQMNLKWKRISVALIAIFNLVYNIPTLWLSGTGEVSVVYSGTNVTALSCLTGTGTYPLFEKIWYGLLSLVVVANIVCTTAIYIPVAVIVCRQFSKRKALQSSNETSVRSMDTSSTIDRTDKISTLTNTDMTMKKSQSAETFDKNISRTSSFDSDFKMSNESETSTSDTNKEDIPSKTFQSLPQLENSNKNKTKKSRGVNFNAMFMLIVIIYVVSYIPTSAMILVTKSVDNFWYSLSQGELLLYNGLSRMFIFNHIANPFIYGYFDLKFKEKLFQMIRRS
ncbi:hypothetical protein FSP39_011208 [Pinctada imbricata]|uniref:G-protein coupled receptors family 1 profile domain-containing protein n=1 Tax=Pinctada imbricata TaxID=66713 RepID=A0AA88Y6J7_PINIB|nr:hypothetical protein FSP39_011208 [Pinctada imbricata]